MIHNTPLLKQYISGVITKFPESAFDPKVCSPSREQLGAESHGTHQQPGPEGGAGHAKGPGDHESSQQEELVAQTLGQRLQQLRPLHYLGLRGGRHSSHQRPRHSAQQHPRLPQETESARSLHARERPAGPGSSHRPHQQFPKCVHSHTDPLVILITCTWFTLLLH